jgi:ABC-type lipoprotein export system ATPase subunit
MIELEHVTKSYASPAGVVEAVKDACLNVAGGEFLMITGRSGSGKTTLLNLIAGTARPTRGQVRLAGKEISRLSDRQQAALRAEQIGFVFQFPSLVPSLTALENVILPTGFTRHSREDCEERAAELLDMVGLGDKLHSQPRQLSAGQQQRVVIARAMINQPSLLLADEPTSDLDEQTEMEIIQLFRQIHAEQQLTIVMVTHTSQLVPFGTRAIEMAGGVIRERIVN